MSSEIHDEISASLPAMKLLVENLSCVRGTRAVFENVSFSLGRAESMVLKGPNGTGKTSLLRMLAGFIPAAEGKISLQIGEPDLDVGEECHYAGHLSGIKHSLTVAENLEFWASFLGGGEIGPALACFSLDALREIPAALLSAGQKRRLSLARLLVAVRPLWLLDEPSVSLDQASIEALAAAVRRHIDQGGMVVAATHVPFGVEFTHTLNMGGATVNP